MDEGNRREESFSLRSTHGISLILLIVATAFYLLGFLSPGWTKRTVFGYTFSEGLWEVCASRSDFDIPGDGWHMATRAMMTLGLICLLLTVILMVGYTFVNRLKEWRQILRFVIPAVTLAAIVFSVIGLAIYGSNRESPHWSYAVTVIASTCLLASAVFMIISCAQSYRGL